MATYVIGDLQGCYEELQLLLSEIGYRPGQDDVWLVGDLVNRGPDSLDCLRWAANHAAVVVLGNHDLHLLAVSAGVKQEYANDTITDILTAPDRNKLLQWLRCQPLLHHDKDSGYMMVHAGLPPEWSVEQATKYAGEVQQQLSSDDYLHIINNMYGHRMSQWSQEFTGMDRFRFTINALTRIRYCTLDGAMDFFVKCAPGEQPTSLIPWFMLPQRKSRQQQIVFGHWSTLSKTDMDFSKWNVSAIDDGCVWGGRLTAMCLQDSSRYSVPARNTAVI